MFLNGYFANDTFLWMLMELIYLEPGKNYESFLVQEGDFMTMILLLSVLLSMTAIW